MKVRVGDLIRLEGDLYTFYRVNAVTADRVQFSDCSGRSLSSIVEVIRPAKRRTLTKKQAREWLSGQEHWEVLETPQQFTVGCSTSPITCRQYAVGPTFIAAVIALRKKIGVK